MDVLVNSPVVNAGQVEIDDMHDETDIQATGGNRRGNHDGRLGRAEGATETGSVSAIPIV